MKAEHLVVFVEEPSMAAALESLLPKIVGALSFRIIQFQCKNDLVKKLPDRLRGYRWIPENWAILVLVDRDDDDCAALKDTLEQAATTAGFVTKTCAGKEQSFQVINRIVVEELESWFFGDWTATRKAYPRLPETVPQKEQFRNPDAISGGTWEALERLLQRAGYFATGLRKIECARAIAGSMDAENNTSHSFTVFASALKEIA